MRNHKIGGVMRCQSCNSNEVTVVGFHSGVDTTYRFCRVCENSTWETSGENVKTQQILELASRIEPGRRRAAA